jgi:hypothetical protein
MAPLSKASRKTKKSVGGWSCVEGRRREALLVFPGALPERRASRPEVENIKAPRRFRRALRGASAGRIPHLRDTTRRAGSWRRGRRLGGSRAHAAPPVGGRPRNPWIVDVLGVHLRRRAPVPCFAGMPRRRPAPRTGAAVRPRALRAGAAVGGSTCAPFSGDQNPSFGLSESRRPAHLVSADPRQRCDDRKRPVDATCTRSEPRMKCRVLQRDLRALHGGAGESSESQHPHHGRGGDHRAHSDG